MIENKYKELLEICCETKKQLVYDTHSMQLRYLLEIYKQYKKEFILRYPLAHQALPINFLAMLLYEQGCPHDFIMTQNHKICVGYDELRLAHKWINKGYPLIKDGVKYYFDELPVTVRENILNTRLRVRIYDDFTNIDSLIRRLYGYNFNLSTDKGDKKYVS